MAYEWPWLREDWVPRFEYIEWPRLAALRDRHHELVHAYRDATARPSALQARFADEDARAFTAELEAVRADRPSPDGNGPTSPLRRAAELEVAQERVVEARDALYGHVERIVSESFDRQPEVEEIVANATKAVHSRPTTEAEGVGSSDEAREPALAVSPADLAGCSALDRDCQRLASWLSVSLAAGGENVRNEIEQMRGEGTPTGSAAEVSAAA